MKKKMMCLLTAVIMIMIAAFSLTGCKVSNSKKPAEKPVQVEQNTNATVKLTIAPRNSTREESLVATWINAYQKKNTNVGIEITQKVGNVDEYITMVSDGSMPDIVWTMDEGHAYYSSEGFFYDLSDETKFPGSDEFFGGMYDAVVDATHYSREGAGMGKYFVPRDYNRLTIIYNKTMFENMDIDLPTDDWTWDDFLETCEKLQTTTNGYACTKAIEWPDWAPVYTTMLANHGAKYIDDEGYFALDNTVNGKIPAQECYDWMKEFYSKYAYKGLEGSAFKAYVAGKKKANVGMFLKQYADLGNCVDAANDAGWEVDAVAFPRFTNAPNEGKGYVGAGCSGYAISTTCEDDDKIAAAWDFLKWCMSEEGYEAVAHLGIVCPALKELNDKGAWTEYKQGNRPINYKAFVDTHTDDLALNYEQVLPKASNQSDVRAWALTFWKGIGENTFKTACDAFKKDYSNLLPDKVRG